MQINSIGLFFLLKKKPAADTSAPVESKSSGASTKKVTKLQTPAAKPKPEVKSKSDTNEIQTESIKDDDDFDNEDTSSSSTSTAKDMVKNLNVAPVKSKDLNEDKSTSSSSSSSISSSSSSSKTKSSKAKTTPHSASGRETKLSTSENKYDEDDFVLSTTSAHPQNKHSSSSGASSSSSSTSAAKKKVISSLKTDKDLDLKADDHEQNEDDFSKASTVSEISEEILPAKDRDDDDDESKAHVSINEDIHKVDTGLDEEESNSDSANHSTGTQILILGRDPVTSAAPAAQTWVILV